MTLDRLETLRARLGLSWPELGRVVGVSSQTLRNLANGGHGPHVSDATALSVTMIADALARLADTRRL